MIDLNKLINQRIEYPLNSKKENKNDIDYILNCIESSSETLCLILPSFYFQKQKNDISEIKNLLFENHFIAAILGLGKIYEPYSSINLTLFVFKKKEPKHIHINDHPKYLCYEITGKVPGLKSLVSRVITESYKIYLSKIENNLKNNNVEDDDFFKIKYSELNRNKLYLNYYLPGYKVIEEKLSNEKTVALNRLADIYIPKKSKQTGKVLKIKNFKYPLDLESLSEGQKSNIKLIKGDIVMGSVGKIAPFLIDKDYPGLSPCLKSYVIRLKTDKVTPEYLFLYLKSEIFKKYVLKHLCGDAIKAINKDALESLPIIIPSKLSLNTSNEAFNKLFYNSDNSINEINELIFSKKKIKTRIQEEFINELLQKLSSTKLKLIQEIIDQDFREIKICIENEAFKASVVLCGSILEAILLDWLSEIKKKNYLSSRDEISLYNMIEEMRKSQVFDEILTTYAHELRKIRNIVHPKNALSKTKSDLNQKLVKDMIWKLKKILEKRNLV